MSSSLVGEAGCLEVVPLAASLACVLAPADAASLSASTDSVEGEDEAGSLSAVSGCLPAFSAAMISAQIFSSSVWAGGAEAADSAVSTVCAAFLSSAVGAAAVSVVMGPLR